MEKFAAVIWWILRAVILLALIGLTVGTGACGIALLALGGSPDVMTIVVVAGIALLTLLLGWIAWIVGMALFRRRPPDAGP